MTAQPGWRWRILAWNRDGGQIDQRYTRSDGFKFDELVIDDWLHIEEMAARHYWMQVCDLHINVVVPSNGPPRIASTWVDA